jgi:hypothetical protein
VLADFGGDGDLDIAVSNRFSYEVIVLPNNGSGSFGFGQSFATAERPVMIAGGDVDGDGDIDLAVADLQGLKGAVGVMLNECGSGPEPCPADLAEPFDTLNFFDLSAYLSLYNAQDPAADLAAPLGVLNFFDLSEYLSLYNAGCP